MSENTIKFPALAEPNIEEVLRQFLDASAQRLKPATLRKYQSVIELFIASMNNYGSGTLGEAETALFEQFYDAKGKAHREFCQIFGPDKIAGNVDEFLGYFMPRKVMCGKELLQAAGTATRKLAAWLNEQGYLDEESAAAAAQSGAAAAKALPAGERLAEALDRYCEAHAPDEWTEEIDDYFTVEKIEPGKLHLSPLLGAELDDDDAIVVSLPKAITDLCQVGWQINLAIGKTKKGWRLLESGNVDPL